MPKRTTSVRQPRAESRPKNKLLASLPQAEFERLRPHLRTRPVRAKQVFHSMDEPIRDIVFPNGGVASITTVLQDGTMIEIATVGREGMLGIDVVLGGDRSAGKTMLQVPDTDAVFLLMRQRRPVAPRPFVQRAGQMLSSLRQPEPRGSISSKRR